MGDLVLPAVGRAQQLCAPTLAPKAPGYLPSLGNESSHLHRRMARLGWLVGDAWPAEVLPPAIAELAAGISIFSMSEPFAVAGTPSIELSDDCLLALMSVRLFYAALRELVLAMRVKREAVMRKQNGVSLYLVYFLVKDVRDAACPQEAQLAQLYRASQMSTTGVPSTQCVCQLHFATLYQLAIERFLRRFHFDYVDPQRPLRAALLEGLLEERASCSLDDETLSHVADVESLTTPAANQLSGPTACTPYRALMGMVCGQAAMAAGKLPKAQQYFHFAMWMLAYTVDCFDAGVDASGGLPSPTLQNLLAYIAALDARVAPAQKVPYAGGPDEDRVRHLLADPWRRRSQAAHVYALRLEPRSLSRSSMLKADEHAIRAGLDVVILPPLCLGRSGDISLQLGLPTHSHAGVLSQAAEDALGDLKLLDGSGVHSLVPIVGRVAPAASRADNTAVLMAVDSISWRNLGHMIMFLVPYLQGAFLRHFARGGLPAVWRRREELQVYLFLPRGSQEHALQGRPELVHWLPLMSARRPMFFSDASRAPVPASALPSGVDLGDGGGPRCHLAGQWGGSLAGVTKDGLDLFVRMASSFPAWQIPSREALLRRVWARQQGPREGGADPCLDPHASTCFRVLLVQRGSIGVNARRIVNIDAVRAFMEASYPLDEVRVSIVRMEDFSLAEEIALAQLTDVLIGAYGSAMWWGVFMPEGSCLLWLLSVGTPPDVVRDPLWPRIPLWSRESELEYKALRRLWHVFVQGAVPPLGSGYEGVFELDADTLAADMLAMQSLDIYVDIKVFMGAFHGIVKHLRAAAGLKNRSGF